MRNLLLIFLCVFSFLTNSFGQKDSLIIKIELTDKSFKEVIPNVNSSFKWGDRSIFKHSNPKGIIWLKVPIDISLEYSFSHPLYESLNGTKKISAKNAMDTLLLSFEMFQIKNQNFKEVVVKAPGVPDTVFQSKRLSVSDFEILNNGNLMLLVYPKQLKKGSELLYYDGKQILNSFNVPGTAEQMVRDYRGNPHVVCAENVYGIHVNNERIGISSLEKDYYLKYLAPILDTSKSKLFFSNFNSLYPAFNYFAFDQLDSVYSKIIHIEDELMMELYRSEYKWVDVRTKLWAKNKELATGIDAEIWVGANYFTQSIYYKELYAPLFLKKDTIYVFDYYKDKLFSYNNQGNPIDSISIYHHYQPKSSGWCKQLIQDQVTKEIYGLFEKAGYMYLGRIDTKTGRIDEKVKLEFRYVDKVAVHNNFVYYIYRPFESVQKKFLYKERLPYANENLEDKAQLKDN